MIHVPAQIPRSVLVGVTARRSQYNIVSIMVLFRPRYRSKARGEARTKVQWLR